MQFHTLLNDDALKMDVNMQKAIVQTFIQILPGIDAKYRDECELNYSLIVVVYFQMCVVVVQV